MEIPRNKLIVVTGVSGSGKSSLIMQCPMGCTDAAHGCNMCTPNGTYCTSSGVQSCGSDGAPTTFESCAGGCVADPSPHCAHLLPRYLTNACDARATADLDVTADATLGTDLDSACTGGIVRQTAAPDICIVRNSTITVESGATLKATGGRVLALVADDSLAIHGVLDASADGQTSGPGGGGQSSGGGRGTSTGTGTCCVLGGGGAGFHTAGGAGGAKGVDGGAANAGPATGDPAQLQVMVGGPHSGPVSGGGGGGGGGVILVACRGDVTIDGVVDLGGGGGAGGINTDPGFPHYAAGAGGGAGGYLVIEALGVSVTGKAYANGGGGGAGYYSPNGQAGADGSRSATNGATGGAPQTGIGGGGVGACSAPAGGGGQSSIDGGDAGGGGGVGWLQTYTPQGVAPTITPMEASPSFQPNATVQTQ